MSVPKPCPIWGYLPYIDQDIAYYQDCTDHGKFYSPRAGGLIGIGGDLPREGPVLYKNLKTDQSQELTPSDKANLSYWIYRHNWDVGLLQPTHPQALRRHVHARSSHHSRAVSTRYARGSQ